ncbi:hypothetical protein ILYODFUR_027560 [Ilyodon furcidens]|uniref:Uncharacterized protein n=1 Tax=Ilyodon furcidens TaxID=33524 RepID=A0ABV0T249_9TELE
MNKTALRLSNYDLFIDLSAVAQRLSKEKSPFTFSLYLEHADGILRAEGAKLAGRQRVAAALRHRGAHMMQRLRERQCAQHRHPPVLCLQKISIPMPPHGFIRVDNLLHALQDSCVKTEQEAARRQDLYGRAAAVVSNPGLVPGKLVPFSSSLDRRVFGLWEEAGVPSENPRMHGENMQTPCRKTPG